MKRNSGIHTVALSKPKQGYHALQAMADDAYAQGYSVEQKRDRYNLNHTYELNGMSDQGISVKIKQFATHPGFARVKLALGSMLSGSYDPLRLYDGDGWDSIQEIFRDSLQLEGLCDGLNKLALARVDMTEDSKLDNAAAADAYVAVIAKSVKSGKYRRHRFSGASDDVDDPAVANRHSVEYCTKTRRKDRKRQRETGTQPRTAFKAYNKGFDINRINRKKGTPDRVAEDVLRLELTHTGTALRRKLKLGKGASNGKIVDTATERAHELIWRFMKASMFVGGDFLRYDHAVKLIETSTKIKDEDRQPMLELVRKCSDCENICNAARAMELNRKSLEKLLRRFKKLGISPVTIPNNNPIKRLPSLTELMGEENANG